MLRFRSLVFDMDGVLVNTSRCHSRAYEDLWGQVGIDAPPYDEIAGRKTTEVVREITAKLRPSATQLAEWVAFKQEQARKYLATENIAFSDTAPCLAAVARARIGMALGTTASRSTTNSILGRLGIAYCFSTVLTAEDVNNGKPSPEIYVQLMARATMSHRQTLIVEDSTAGLKAAIASQAYVASVRTGKKVEHPRFVGSFRDLRTLVLKLGIQV